MITIDNYEAYLLQYAEGMLSKKECAEVEDFLKNHPDLQDEMVQFYDSDFKVTAPDIEMPNKQALKHRLVMPIVWRSVVAACLIGVGVFGGIKLMSPQLDSSMLAKVEPIVALEESTNRLISSTVEEKDIQKQVEPAIAQVTFEEKKTNNVVDIVDLSEKPIKESIVDPIEESIIDPIEEPVVDPNSIMNDDFLLDYPVSMESNQLIAMSAEEPIVIKTENLIQIEDSVIQSKDLIKIEVLSLKTIVDTYVTTPLVAQAEKTKVKVVDQLYAVADEFRNRYINN